MQAMVLDDAVVESGAMIAAGSLVTQGRRVTGGKLWAGRPARIVRDLTPAEQQMLVDAPRFYTALATEFEAEIAALGGRG
jgi:carbonic anhydrase/acetyltransferase-like protein (isoleucine patch superfamily)